MYGSMYVGDFGWGDWDISGTTTATWPDPFGCDNLENGGGFLGSGSGTYTTADRQFTLSEVTVAGQTYWSYSDGGRVVASGRWATEGHQGSFAMYYQLEAYYDDTCTFDDEEFHNGYSESESAVVFVGGSVPDAVDTLIGLLPEDVEGLDELVKILPPGFGSSACEFNGGPRVVDATNGGVRTFVYAYQPSTTELWLCTRVEDTTTGEGYGGRLELTPTDPEASGTPGTPSFDSSSQACTTTTDPANQVPTTHPIGSGGVLTVDYLIDAYMNADEAWLCVEAGTAGYRVKVPLGSDGTGVSGTAVVWEPDEGTPSG